MTPKEKAEELLNKYYNEVPYYGQGNDQKHQEAKLCVLIMCEELISFMPAWTDSIRGTYFWIEVKKEIEKL